MKESKPTNGLFGVRESVPLAQIDGYLRLMEGMGRLVYQRNNTGAVRDTRNRPVTFGKQGSPDFYVFLPNGRTLHVEVKRPVGGKQSASQRAWQAAVEVLGHTYLLVTDVAEVQRLVEGDKA